jgi:hypothetical protein
MTSAHLAIATEGEELFAVTVSEASVAMPFRRDTTLISTNETKRMSDQSQFGAHKPGIPRARE